MASFSLHQRYSSTAEPELGIGIVTETSKGRVTVHFPGSGETRMYASETAPLRRVRFKAGDTVVDRNGRSLVVADVVEEDGLIRYMGQGRSISEADLGNMRVQHGPEDRLLTGDVDSPALYALRRRTLEFDHARRISPVNGFLGGRIELIPHQLYIADEVSKRYAPRVLLSDEVGLGKTIEACLVLHRLLVSGRIRRVLILVPESLVHQWFVELLRRFNLWFHIFDERRCASAEKGAPEGNPFLDDQLILCSTAFLVDAPKRAAQAVAANWDMLVVDEAHHLEWAPDRPSQGYLVVEALSKATAGLMLLTATPEQLGVESHFARLRLLDPDRYTDLALFKSEAAQYVAMAGLVEGLANGAVLEAEDARLLKELVGEDRAAAVQAGGAEARQALIQDLCDRHGPGRVVFRNRRSAMQGFPKREARLAKLAAGEDEARWLAVMADECRRDFGFSADMEPYPGLAAGDDPRIDWLAELMQAIAPGKVLLICHRKEKLLALEAALRKRGEWNLGVYHEDLTLVQRDRQAAWFAEEDGARMLICSEIGSEGRNFQFAHHLVLLDLPMSPDLLEQRIGRLDRIGQSADIQIHVPYIAGSVQEVLVRWYHEGLNAFEEHLVGGEQVAGEFAERLQGLILGFDPVESQGELQQLVDDSKTFKTALGATLAKGRDRLLEMNSFRPEVAAGLLDSIRAEGERPVLERYLLGVFEQYQVEVEDLAARTYLLHVHPQHAGAFPGIPEEGIAVTFDRKRALSREEVAFLSWDHPIVTDVMDVVLGTGTGSASFALLRGGGRPGWLVEAVFVLETAGSGNRAVDRFMPNTPVRVVMDMGGQDVTERYPTEAMEGRLVPGDVDDLLENEVFVEGIFPELLARAEAVAAGKAELLTAMGLRRMESTMGQEIDRLEALQAAHGHVRPGEIALARAERAQLKEILLGARLRLDAVMVVQVVG